MNYTAEGYNAPAEGLVPSAERQYQQQAVYPANGYYDEYFPQHAYLQESPAYAPEGSSTDAQMSGAYGHQAPTLNIPPQGPGYIYTFPSSPVAYFHNGSRDTELLPAGFSHPYELEGASHGNTSSEPGIKPADNGAPAQIKKPRAQRTKKATAPEAIGKTKPATVKGKRGVKNEATGTQSGEQQVVKKATKVRQACLPCQIDNKRCTENTFHECPKCIKDNMMCDWDDRYVHFRFLRKDMTDDQRAAEIMKTRVKTVINQAEAKVIRPLVSALKKQYPKGVARPPIRIARPNKAWFASEEEVREYREALALLPPAPPPETPENTSGNATASTSALITAPASGGSGSTNAIAGPSGTSSGTLASPPADAATVVAPLDIDPSLDEGQAPYAVDQHGAYPYDQQEYYQQYHVAGDQYLPPLQYHHAQQQENMSLPNHDMSYPKSLSSFAPFSPGSYPPSSFHPGYLSLPGSVSAPMGTMGLPGMGEGAGESSDEEGMVVTPAMGAGVAAVPGTWGWAGMNMEQGHTWWAGDHAAGNEAAAGDPDVARTFAGSFAYPSGLGLDLGISSGGFDAGLVDYEGWSGAEGCVDAAGEEEERVREW
ncbi:hypothetical protein IAT38_008240 [Cryptococcus sp. DSM 104549]